MKKNLPICLFLCFSIGFKNQFEILLIFSQLLFFPANWDFHDKQKKEQEWNVRVIEFNSTDGKQGG